MSMLKSWSSWWFYQNSVWLRRRAFSQQGYSNEEDCRTQTFLLLLVMRLAANSTLCPLMLS